MKIEVNETTFVLDLDKVTVLRQDQPALVMPLADMANMVSFVAHRRTAAQAAAEAVYEAQAKRVIDDAMDVAVKACLKGEPLSEEAMRQTLAPLHQLGRVFRLALARNDLNSINRG